MTSVGLFAIDVQIIKFTLCISQPCRLFLNLTELAALKHAVD